MLGGDTSLKEGSKINGKLPLASDDDGWVAYSSLKVCFQFYRIDLWAGLYIEWNINDILIESLY